jgi:hypothetical protein
MLNSAPALAHALQIVAVPTIPHQNDLTGFEGWLEVREPVFHVFDFAHPILLARATKILGPVVKTAARNQLHVVPNLIRYAPIGIFAINVHPLLIEGALLDRGHKGLIGWAIAAPKVVSEPGLGGLALVGEGLKGRVGPDMPQAGNLAGIDEHPKPLALLWALTKEGIYYTEVSSRNRAGQPALYQTDILTRFEVHGGL